MSELPVGWASVLFSEINCFLSRTLNPSQFSDELFELFSVPSFPKRKPEIARGKEIGSTKQVVEPEDVLVCKINPRINRVWQVTPKREYQQIASSEWVVMRAPGLAADYLAYYFSSAEFRRMICAEVSGMGGSLTRVQPKRVATFPIKIAPINEQKRIVDKLNKLIARVDACRDRLDRVPHILKRFRQSILAEAFSEKLMEDWQVDHSEQPNFNNSSISGQLADFADVIDPNPSHRYPSYVGGTIPLLATEQMYGLNDWDIASARLTTLDFYEARKSAHDFLNDDIVFARKGRLGLARNPPANIRYVFSHTVFIIRVKNEKVLPSYLLWFLRQKWCIDWLLLEMNSNAGIPTLGKLVMERLPIKVPNYAEQQRIVQHIEKLYASADRLEDRYQNSLRQVEKITSVLLSKAFCGKLVPQDPNDESATILLERIRAEQIAKPERAVLKRKPKMPKITEESVKEIIRQLPSEKFSFDELREKIPGDYDLFKDILFTLLSEAEPSLMQVFDQEAEAMHFVRRN